MQRVQPIELGFKLQAQLHLFFMRADVLIDFLLKLDPELDLLIEAFPELSVFTLHLIKAYHEPLLVLVQLAYLLVEVLFHLFHLLLVLGADLGDEHLIVALAAVLEKDRIYFPDT